MYDAIFFTDMSSKVYHVRPLGAYRLASELRTHGYRVLVVDYFSKWLQSKKDLLKLIQTVISKDTLFVGYSSTFFSEDNQIKESVDSYENYYGGYLSTWPVNVQTINLINKYIKACNPNIKIVYGGASAVNLTPELQNSGVDLVVQGLADTTVVEIMNSLKMKKHIPYNLKNNMKVIDHDIFATKFNFTDSFTQYEASDCFDADEVLSLETSRGCLFKCSFCAFPLIGRKKNDLSYHKPTSVIASELKRNYEMFNVTKYMFVDDTFNESTEKLLHIHDAIKQSGVDIKFSCYLRLDLLNRYPEQIRLLKEMGIQSAFLGIETLNRDAGVAIGKTSHPEKVKASLQMLKDEWGDNVVTHGSFISGLPHETEETIDEWMDWVYNSNLLTGYIIGALYLKGSFSSDITRNPAKYGYQVNDWTWVNNKGLNSTKAKEISNRWMEKSWDNRRLKISGWDMLGLQNLGYEFTTLKNLAINDLPFKEIALKYESKFARYRTALFNFLERQL